MSSTEALVLCLVMLPLAAMSSASVALVVARTVSAGPASGVFAAFGIVVGDLIFVVVALVGVSALAEWLGAFFTVVKYCGGIYLIWLGVRTLRSKPLPRVPYSTPRRLSFAGDFLAGLALTLGDIKVILFYASLFPALIDVETIGLPDVSLIAAITTAAVGGVKLTYVALSSKLVEKFHGLVSSDTPRKLGGTLMIGCGSVMIAKT